jgi:hypothetical protein
MNENGGFHPHVPSKSMEPNALKASDESHQVELLALRLQGVLCDIKNVITTSFSDDREGSKKLYFAACAIGTVVDYLEGHEGHNGSEAAA